MVVLEDCLTQFIKTASICRRFYVYMKTTSLVRIVIGNSDEMVYA